MADSSKLTMTSQALLGIEHFKGWLKANPTHIMKNGVDTGKTTARQCTASASVDPDLYVELVARAAEEPGGRDGDDLDDGVLAKIVRRAVFVYLRPKADVSAYEAEREASIKAALQAKGELLGANAKVTKSKLDLLAQLAESNPDIASMLAQLESAS